MKNIIIDNTVEKQTLAFHPGWIETIKQMTFECEMCCRDISMLNDIPYKTDDGLFLCADCYIRYKEY